ncbi:MAG: MoaD/ThiS family protein [Phycisphaerales bacterium]
MAHYTILLFGPASSAIGRGQVEVCAEEPISVDAIKQEMIGAFPAIEQFVCAGRLAVNQGFVGDDEVVGFDAEIALISMVSGG